MFKIRPQIWTIPLDFIGLGIPRRYMRSSWDPIGGRWNGLEPIGVDWGQLEWIGTQHLHLSSDLCDDLISQKSVEANPMMKNKIKTCIHNHPNSEYGGPKPPPPPSDQKCSLLGASLGIQFIDLGSVFPQSSVRAHLVHPSSDQGDAFVRKSHRTSVKLIQIFQNGPRI